MSAISGRTLAIIGCVVMCAAFACGQTSRSASAYDRWIDDDVSYIITPQERADYLKLTTDEARNAFVIDFWEKRNPTPGKAENTFKEEHYRRIAYANEHFAAAEQGWKTDRGKTYILLGGPDEIATVADHRFNGQQWHYRASPLWPSGRTITFYDYCGCNQYELEK